MACAAGCGLLRVGLSPPVKQVMLGRSIFPKHIGVQGRVVQAQQTLKTEVSLGKTCTQLGTAFRVVVEGWVQQKKLLYA